MTEKYVAIGDLKADTKQRDVTEIYQLYSASGLRADETIYLNWRVINTENKRTVAIFGGPSGYQAARVYADFCNKQDN